jgi:hypothetical protein
MEPLTFEAVSRNPELVQALIRQAHRERAEAVYRFIVEPIKSLFTPGDHPGRVREPGRGEEGELVVRQRHRAVRNLTCPT